MYLTVSVCKLKLQVYSAYYCIQHTFLKFHTALYIKTNFKIGIKAFVLGYLHPIVKIILFTHDFFLIHRRLWHKIGTLPIKLH